MKTKAVFIGVLLSLIIIFSSHAQKDEFPVLKGPYLGQKPPGMIPKIFAPDIVSTGHHEHSSPAFSADGREVYWSVFLYYRSPQVILYSRKVNDKWTRPEVAPFSGQYSDGNPSLSADGKKLYFISNRPLKQDGPVKKDHDIWVVERNAGGWEVPKNLGQEINSDLHEASVSVCNNGTLYFTTRNMNDTEFGIYFSRMVKGKYSKPKRLNGLFDEKYPVGWIYASPDESFLIFDLYDQPDSMGNGDLYIAFKKNHGSWTKAKNMGTVINSPAQDRFAGLTGDGKYLFFNNNKRLSKPYFQKSLKYKEIIKLLGSPGNGYGDVYWVDTKIIEELKPKELK
jgi:hypothetical protein